MFRSVDSASFRWLSSRCLSDGDVAELRRGIPPRFSGFEWRALFKSSDLNDSLEDYYENYRKFFRSNRIRTGGCITAVRDNRGDVFGCYTALPWTQSETLTFVGCAFLFKIENGKVDVYQMSRPINVYQHCYKDGFGLVEPNGKNILRIGRSLRGGFSFPSTSFASSSTSSSPRLSSRDHFFIDQIEFYVLLEPTVRYP